ncbi:MAG: hypothetical protein WBP29_09740 [Candidatus Zixiibacteriota bacterium]
MRICLSIFVALSVIALWACGENPTKNEDVSDLQIGNLPQTVNQIPATHVYRNQFTLLNADTLQTYVWQVTAIGKLPSGTYSINQKGSFAFESAEIDSGITFDFRVHVLLDRTERAFHDFSVQIIGSQPVILHLVQRSQPATPDSRVEVSIVKTGGDLDIGSLRLWFIYDPAVLIPVSAYLGYDPYVCRWEYFTYRFFQDSQLTEPLSNSSILLSAISDVNNGTSHPTCTHVEDGAELFRIAFKAVNDSSLNCTTSPLQFIWVDCSSNAIYCATDQFDSIFVGSVAMKYDWDGSYPLDDFRMDRADCYSSNTPSLSGWCERFFPDCKAETVADRIIFWNGQVQFDCK